MKSEEDIRKQLEYYSGRLYNTDEEVICYMDKGWQHALKWVLSD